MVVSHTFSYWRQTSDDAGALRVLLSDPKIWEQQRSDHCAQPGAVNANYRGSFVSIFRKDEKPCGFVLYLYQDRGLYEMHIGFKDISCFAVISSVRQSLAALFKAAPFASIVAAACPDWNRQVCRLAGIMRSLLVRGKKAVFEPYHVASFSRRDGRSYGATVFSITRSEILHTERSNEAWA